MGKREKLAKVLDKVLGGLPSTIMSCIIRVLFIPPLTRKLEHYFIVKKGWHPDNAHRLIFVGYFVFYSIMLAIIVFSIKGCR